MKNISNFHSSLFILNECHGTIERLYFEFNKYSQTGTPYHCIFRDVDPPTIDPLFRDADPPISRKFLAH